MGSPAKDIATILQTDGVGTLGSTIFYGKLPKDIDSCVVVFDTGGVYANPKWKRDELLVQVIIRGPKEGYEAGYALAKKVKDSLLGRDAVTVDSIDYIFFVMNGDINALGYDDRNRPQFSTNWRICRENVPGGNRDAF
jgi:hypothetical protein